MATWRRDATLTDRARTNRQTMNPAEQIVWHHLRRRALGVRFRRQEPLAGCIVDFVCKERKLVVEIDGETHVDEQADARRDEHLARLGYTTVRFWNDDVYDNIGGVIETIARALGRG